VYAGTDPLTRRPIRLRATAKTETQARIELGKLLEKASDGRSPEAGVTMAKLLDEYAPIAQWDVSTRQTNEGFIRRTLKPAIGHLKIRQVNGEILDKLYARLLRCRDLFCTGHPFTEHRHMPVLNIDPADIRPAWKQVAAELTEAITSGVLLPGDEMPSITEASRLQGIGTGVIRHALEALTADGIIVARRKPDRHRRRKTARHTKTTRSRPRLPPRRLPVPLRCARQQAETILCGHVVDNDAEVGNQVPPPRSRRPSLAEDRDEGSRRALGRAVNPTSAADRPACKLRLLARGVPQPDRELSPWRQRGIPPSDPHIDLAAAIHGRSVVPVLPLRVSASEPLHYEVEVEQRECCWPCEQEQQGVVELASGEPCEACAGQNHDHADNDVLARLPNRVPPAEAERVTDVQP
jgi:DNA-binding transcriptional regulator YhcF (GntR family)